MIVFQTVVASVARFVDVERHESNESRKPAIRSSQSST
jgi:hypothetical protein